MDPLGSAEFIKLSAAVLTTSNRAETQDAAVVTAFKKDFELLEDFESIILVLEEVDPRVPSPVISKGKNIPCA